VENWGAGYFEVNRKGHLAVRPAEGDPRSLDVNELIDQPRRPAQTTAAHPSAFPTDSHQPIEKSCNARFKTRRANSIIPARIYGFFP